MLGIHVLLLPSPPRVPLPPPLPLPLSLLSLLLPPPPSQSPRRLQPLPVDEVNSRETSARICSSRESRVSSIVSSGFRWWAPLPFVPPDLQDSN